VRGSLRVSVEKRRKSVLPQHLQAERGPTEKGNPAVHKKRKKSWAGKGGDLRSKRMEF